MEIISILRVLVLLITLGYATYLDIESRRVPDKYWVPGTIVALSLVGYDLYTSEQLYVVLTEFVSSLVIVGATAYILYRYRVFYGADYKAFLFIAVLVPTTPELFSLPIYGFDPESVDPSVIDREGIHAFLVDLNRHFALDMFGFTVLVNSALMSIVYFFTNTYHNIKKGVFSIRRPLRSITARRLPSDEIDQGHYQLIRSTESNNPIIRGYQFIRNGMTGVSSDFYRDYLDWHRSQAFNSPNDQMSDLDEIKIDEFAQDNEEWKISDTEGDKKVAETVLYEDEVWVTPGVPFILPITLGAITALFFGNIWYIIMSLIA